MLTKALIVYLEQEAPNVKVCESELPDSSVPRVWGLPDDVEIIATVIIPRAIDWKTQCQVFVDEEEAVL